jgi:hypothetical protein
MRASRRSSRWLSLVRRTPPECFQRSPHRSSLRPPTDGPENLRHCNLGTRRGWGRKKHAAQSDLLVGRSRAMSSKYLTLKGLSALTGISDTQLRRLKRDHRIPFFQPGGKGGKLYFPPDAIEKSGPPQSEAEAPGVPKAGRRPKWMSNQD